MKSRFAYILLAAALFTACSTQQIDQTRAIADPLVKAAIASYASTYGVPPVLTDQVTSTLQSQFWGMLAQKYAGQPVAQGSAIPAVGQAVAAQNPTTGQLVAALTALGAPKQALVPTQP